MSLTESVYLDAVSPDGRTGFVTRLARHVDDGVAWQWLHVFHPDLTVAFVRDDITLDAGPTVESSTGARYVLESASASAWFDRAGPKEHPRTATVTVSLAEASIELSATFEATGPAGSNLPGRTEVLGRVTAEVRTDAGVLALGGLGQFHEQHQTEPRFKWPFTYGTLRGDDLGLVFVVGPRRSFGFVRRGDHSVIAHQVRVDAVGPHRALDLDLEGGGQLHLELERTHHYLLPINGHPRDSSIVFARAGDDALSGCVNDWQPPWA